MGGASVVLATIAVACGSGDDSSGLLPRGPGSEGISSDGGGPVPGEPALLADGAVNPLYCPSGLTECSNACVNVVTDNANCGTCGTACGGTCTAGRCIVTLASGGSGTAIAVDSTSVYFSGSAGLMRVPIGGGAAATLAPGANGAIAVDTKNVYYSTAAGVMSVLVGGGAPKKIGTYAAAGITSNGEGVCWTAVNGYVVSVPVPIDPAAVPVSDGGTDDGGIDAGAPPPPPTTLALSEDYPTGIMAAATAVYWTTSGTLANGGGFAPLSGTVMRFAFADLPEDGGAPPADGGTTTIATGQNYPLAVTADTANVYWTASGTSANSYADGTVMKAPALGGTPTALASAQGFPYGIASDATNVYWANNDNGGSAGAVMSVPIAGGTPVTLAAGLKGPTFLAVDGTSVYWTTAAGMVMKATPK